MNLKRHLKHIATVTLAAIIAITPVVSASAATNYPEFGDNSSRTHDNGLPDSGNWNTTATIKSFSYGGQTLSMGAGGGTTGVANGTGIGYAGMYYFPVSAPYDSSTGGDNPTGPGYLTAWNTGSAQPIEASGWPQKIEGVSNSSPLVEGGNVYLAAGSNLYGFYSSGKAVATPNGNIGSPSPVFVNQVTSHPLWVPNDGLIWVSSQNGYLYGVNPTTLLSTTSSSGGGITVKIGSRMDGSPTLVTDTSGTPYIAQGTAYAAGNQGGTGVLYIVSLSGSVVAKYQDPNGVAIASAPINTGGGNIMWNDTAGNVYHANLVNTGSGVAIQNVHEWSPTTHPGFTNEEAAYVNGYYVLPQTSSGYIEVVNGSQTSSSSMQEVQIPDAVAVGANNVGSPEASASYIYVSDSYADVTQIPIAKLGNLTMTDMTDLAVTGSTHAANLTSINMNMLPDPQGQTVPTIGFESSAGLTLWQNAAASSITLTASASSVGTGTTVSLSAKSTSIPKGDTVQISATPATTPGTLNYGSQTQQNTVATSPYASFTPSATMDATANSGAAQSVTYVATIMSSSASSPVAQSSPVTVTWAAPATLSLSVSPPGSQTTGQPFTLTANTTNAAGDHVVFTQSGSLTNNGGSGTLSGDFQSNVSSIAYPTQTTASYQYQPTATSSQAGSETVTAELLDSSGNPVTNANGQPVEATVSMTWTTPASATQSITLAVTPTTSQTAGSSFTLTATAYNITSGEVIQIAEASAPTPGTLGGSTYVQWLSPGNYASYQFHTSATSSVAQTVTYQASIYPVSGPLINSNTVSAQWTKPATTCAAPPQFTAGSSVSGVSPYVAQVKGNPGDTLTLSVSGATFSTGGSSTAVTLDSSGYGKVTVDQGTAASATITITGDSNGVCATGETLAITWQAAPAVTLTAAANGQNYSAGQTVNVATNTSVSLTATIANAPANNYTLEISDVGLDNTLAGQNNVFANNATAISAQANSASALSDEYQATLILNQTGQHISSGVITVNWSASASTPPPSSGPALTLAVAAATEPTVFSIDTVTATGTNIPSGDTIVITQTNSNGGDTFGGSGHTVSGGGYAVSSASDPFSANVNDASGVGGYTATYNAVAIDPSTGQTVAQSGDVNVTWGQIPAAATVSLSITPTTQQENQYVTATVTMTNVQPQEYVWIYPQNTYSGPNPTPAAYVETGQNGTFTASFTSSQVGVQTYVAVVTNGQVTYGGNNYNINEAVSNPVSVTWTAASAPTVSLGVIFGGVVNTWINGQSVSYPLFYGTRTSVQVQPNLSNYMIGGGVSNISGTMYNPLLTWVPGEVNSDLFVGSGPNPLDNWNYLSAGDIPAAQTYSAQVPIGLGWYTYQAMEPAGSGQTSAGLSNLGYIDWLPPATQGGDSASIQLSASPTTLNAGQSTALTVNPSPYFTNAVGSLVRVHIYNVTDPTNATPVGAYYGYIGSVREPNGTFGESITWHQGSPNGPIVTLNPVNGALPPISYAESKAGTQKFMAYLYEQLPHGYANAWSSSVAVTWQQQCTVPPSLSVQSNQGQGATIVVNDAAGDTLNLTATGGTLSQTTVTKTTTVAFTAASGATSATVTATDATDATCPSVSTSVTWTAWPQSGTPMTFQVTDLLADPGTPASLWTPTNKSATQSNHNGSTDGSTIAGGPPLPTYGNPSAHPAVYVRPDSGFGFRVLWTGPQDQPPTKATAIYTMTNPDGNWRTWTVTGNVATATVQDGANGSLSEYTFFWTPLPKYTTRKQINDWWNLELAAWSLTGNSHATISVTVTFYNGYGPNSGSGTWTWTDPDMAQTLGYPLWYFIHQVPNQPIQPGAKVYHLTTPSGTATGNILPPQGMPSGGGALYTPGNTGNYVNPYPAP
ncbi:MAG: beta strand repeat-containing protein [Bacilli bacterium]